MDFFVVHEHWESCSLTEGKEMTDISKHPILGELYEIASYLDGGALPSSLETTSLISHLSDVTGRIERLIDTLTLYAIAAQNHGIHITSIDCWCQPQFHKSSSTLGYIQHSSVRLYEKEGM